MKVFVPWLDKLSGRGVNVRSVTESLSFCTDREAFVQKIIVAEAEADGMSARSVDWWKRKAAKALEFER